MRATVFRLRDKGQRLDGKTIEARGGVVGEFLFAPRLYRATIMLATLVADDLETYLIPPIDGATLLKVDGRGMLISGTELISRRDTKKARSDGYRQAWWVVPLPATDPESSSSTASASN
jgi:hypothetical protein